MANGGEAASSAYNVPNSDLILPKQSRRLGFLVLLTFGGRNDQLKVGDGSAVRSTLGGGVRLLRWFSGDENRLNRLLMSPSCSSMLQSHRTTMNWTRTGRTPRWLGFGDCGMKFVEHMPLFIVLLVPSCRGHKDLAFLSTNQIQTRLRSKDIAKGVILGFGYDTGTNS
jgi:hypothetical protein